MKFCPFVLKILSGTEILTLIKCHNSVSNVLKSMCNNPILDLVNINAFIKFVKFYQFVIKIFSGNENLTSLKGHNSVTNLRKIIPTLILSISMHIQNFVKLYQLVLKILSGIEIITLVKSHNSNVPKMMRKIFNKNTNEYTKFDKFLSICSCDTKWK